MRSNLSRTICQQVANPSIRAGANFFSSAAGEPLPHCFPRVSVVSLFLRTILSIPATHSCREASSIYILTIVRKCRLMPRCSRPGRVWTLSSPRNIRTRLQRSSKTGSLHCSNLRRTPGPSRRFLQLISRRLLCGRLTRGWYVPGQRWRFGRIHLPLKLLWRGLFFCKN